MKLKGAIDRAAYLKKYHNADFYVGVEGGITEHAEEWLCFSATVILDNDGRKGIGFSSHFPLPQSVVEEIQHGKELGTVMDELSGKSNTKQQGGALLHKRSVHAQRSIHCRHSNGPLSFPA